MSGSRLVGWRRQLSFRILWQWITEWKSLKSSSWFKSLAIFPSQCLVFPRRHHRHMFKGEKSFTFLIHFITAHVHICIILVHRLNCLFSDWCDVRSWEHPLRNLIRTRNSTMKGKLKLSSWLGRKLLVWLLVCLCTTFCGRKHTRQLAFLLAYSYFIFSSVLLSQSEWNLIDFTFLLLLCGSAKFLGSQTISLIEFKKPQKV